MNVIANIDSAVGGIMAIIASNRWPRQTFPSLMLGSLTTAVGISVLPWAMHEKKTGVVYGMLALTSHGIFIRLNPSSIHGLAYFPTLTAPISCLLSFALPFGGLVGLTIMSTVFTNRSGAEQQNAKDGVVWGFVSMIPFMWACVFLTTFLGNAWLHKEDQHEVVNGFWLWSVIMRKELNREKRRRGFEPVESAVLEGEQVVKDDERRIGAAS
jgi:hypothetical protein